MKRISWSLACCTVITLFSAAPAKGNETNTINFGEIASGSIPGPAQTNFYNFSGTSNDIVTVALLRTNGAGVVYLRLTDPDGVLVFQGNDAASLSYEAGRVARTCLK